MKCTKCEQPIGDDADFCEECGEPVVRAEANANAATAAPPAVSQMPAELVPCPTCGETKVTNGVCDNCGESRTRKRTARDYFEQVLAPELVCVSDLGAEDSRNSHDTNQDYAKVARVTHGGKSFDVLVVCDGLSMAQNSEESSKLGCETAVATIVAALEAGVEPAEAMKKGIFAAQEAVVALPVKQHKVLHKPGSTLVGGIIADGTLHYGWVGDSPAYIVYPDTVMQITKPHSWVNDVRQGGWPEWKIEEHVRRNKQLAHTMVRNLGRLDPDEPPFEPEFNTASVVGADYVLFCSDGCADHMPDVKDVKRTVAAGKAGTDALKLAKYLVSEANTLDGHDNVTVAIRAFNQGK